jgi:2-C-methyl-D-erythritol 2,4-cyclodiphosphate synthase
VSVLSDGQLLAIRTGLGYDSHRLVEGKRLVLGGVDVPHSHGLAGHSDADALAHAICDALLGAAGLGDIGTHFPDTDPTYADADSIGLLRRVRALVEVDHAIVNVDSTIHAESPKMAPHIPNMRARLATALGIPERRVNVKAKTGEGVGPVGTGQAIEATAIATLYQRDVA